MNEARQRRAVTTRDIAERMGLAVSTVGRALAGDPRVNEKTRMRVLAVANELDYVGNRAARMMRGAPSNIVGLIIPDIRNSFYSTAAHLLARELGQRGVQVLLAQTDDDPARQLAQIRELSDFRALGVVIVPTPRTGAPTQVNSLDGLPHIQFIRRDPALSGPWAGLDDQQVLRAATETLINGGHVRIGYIGGRAHSWTGSRRVAGYRRALQTAGIDGDESVVRHTDGSPGSAARAVDDLLKLDPPVTGLVCASVLATHEAMLELDRRAVSVPGALSIVGFSDPPGAKWWRQGLTTMELPVAAVAQHCADWSVGLLEGKQCADLIPLPGRLVERGSVLPQTTSHSTPWAG